MNVVNLMNFVRRIDEREDNSTEKLLGFTARQLRLANALGVDNTFLLQYDAVCDPDFVSLFREEATDRTELGLWYEIVEPLASACGIPYRSERGWKWDWHIVPGFSMAYTPAQREALIDEAMRKFREVFGCYPRTVASWLIDTHTLNYLASRYEISAVALCRDQANTDAYTLLGGYFSGAYYPSKNNIFTPAQTKELRTDVPVFRLLGPCPVRNYDNHKYSTDAFRSSWEGANCFTLEPCWHMGGDEKMSEWLFDCFYGADNLGFGYAQTGQENSFYGYAEQVLDGTAMQTRLLRGRGDVRFMKMGETGELFRRLFPDRTPATAVTALSDCAGSDLQSVWYDCENYTANLFRYEDRLFFRCIYLFDERARDLYLTDVCETFDAVYENLPVVDTRECPDEDRKRCGLVFDGDAVPFTTEKTGEGELTVVSGDRRAVFREDGIEITAPGLTLYGNSVRAEHTLAPDELRLRYRDSEYSLVFTGAEVSETDCGDIRVTPTADKIMLSFRRK